MVFFNKENPGERPPLYVQDGTPGYGKSGDPGLAAACKQLINSGVGGRRFILCCCHRAAALLGIENEGGHDVGGGGETVFFGGKPTATSENLAEFHATIEEVTAS